MSNNEYLEKMYIHWLRNFEENNCEKNFSNKNFSKFVEYGYLRALNMSMFVLEIIGINEYNRRNNHLLELALSYNIIQE